MRIGVDGRYQGYPMTGVPRYVHELCLQLDQQLPECRFFLYAALPDGIQLPSERWTLRVEPSPGLARLRPNLWWKAFAHRLIRQDRLDVLWAAAGTLPGRLGALPTVLTVHDLNFRICPETMTRFNLWTLRLFFAGDLRRAQRVLANSEGTSQRCLHYYQRAADGVVRPDASPLFSPTPVIKQRLVREKYGLDRPFLLAVSTQEPRKNLRALVEAFTGLQKKGEFTEHVLALIGKKGWKDADLSSAVAPHLRSSIKLLGFVPDEDLPALYSASALFCMPSLYEGFGMPVLEARRCGARILATNIPELREAGGDACTYVDSDPLSIAAGIRKALGEAHREHAPDGGSWKIEAGKLISHLTALRSLNAG